MIANYSKPVTLQVCSWHIDLNLSSVLSDLKSSSGDGETILSSEQNIADDFSLFERKVGHSMLELSLVTICGGDQSIPSGERVESVIDVSLYLWEFPDLLLLPVLDKLGNSLVHRGVSVEPGSPERSSVVWVVATVEELLGSVVDDWDSLSVENVGNGVLEPLNVIVLVKESNIVLIIGEETEDSWVLEVLVGLLDSVTDVVHGVAISKDLINGEVHWVVESGAKGSLVSSDVWNSSIEDLSNGVDSGGLSELCPETLIDLWNGVNSDTVDIILLDDSLDPFEEEVSNKWNRLIEVWEVGKSADFDGSLIVLEVVSRDLAVLVVVLGLVEWVNDAEVEVAWNITNVVSYDINHDPHILGMHSSYQILEILLSTKFRIELIEVLLPVAVVSLRGVLRDWRDPDSIKAHTLDVIELVDESSPGSSAVVTNVVAAGGGAVSPPEPVCKDLVDGALLPLLLGSAEGLGS